MSGLDYEIQRLKVLLERAGYEVKIRKKRAPIDVHIDITTGTGVSLKEITEAFRRVGEAVRTDLEDVNRALSRFGRAVRPFRDE